MAMEDVALAAQDVAGGASVFSNGDFSGEGQSVTRRIYADNGREETCLWD